MNYEVKKEFGENLRAYRKKAGYTQKDLGEKLNLTLSTVSRWEKGLSFPEFPALYDLCQVLNIDTNDLLGKYALKHKQTTPEERKKLLKCLINEVMEELMEKLMKSLE